MQICGTLEIFFNFSRMPLRDKIEAPSRGVLPKHKNLCQMLGKDLFLSYNHILSNFALTLLNETAKREAFLTFFLIYGS